ncbi:hypothetical protein HYW61_00810 [candidate division WWE3 bacterium]|nr:hypothetical protein [candidate division WWE3 bacterium]
MEDVLVTFPDGFYDDDCPICRAQRKAVLEKRDLTYDEFAKAFKEAQRFFPSGYFFSADDLTNR